MKDSDVSNRISMLRFLMIFGIVVVHTAPVIRVDEIDGSLWGYFTSFLKNGIFRSGVPVLTVISGFLLFNADSDLKYIKLLRKKARTLFVPFVVFNGGHAAAQIVFYFFTGKWIGEDLFAQNLDAWMTSLFAFKGVPENDPLHFLRELIVLILLSPIFGILIRKAPSIGLTAVSLLFLTNSDGYLINRSDMPVEFYVGGLAAVYKWNLKALDKFAHSSLAILCVASALVSIFAIRDITWLRLLAPFLVWSAAFCLVDTRLGRWFADLSDYSFFIYVTHAPLLLVFWIFFQKFFSSIPVMIFTAIAPFAVVILCIGIYKALNVFIPLPLHWALGTRSRNAKTKTGISKDTETVKATQA